MENENENFPPAQEDQRDFEQPPTNAISRARSLVSIDSGSQRCAEACEFLVYLVWAIVFWIKVAETNEAECGSPVWFWANFGKHFFLFSAVISLISQCFMPKNVPKDSVLDKFKVYPIFVLVQTVLRLCSLPFIIGMIISFANSEVCPNLQTLVAVQFWFIVVGLGCTLCCCTCIGAGVLLKGVVEERSGGRGRANNDRRGDYAPV